MHLLILGGKGKTKASTRRVYWSLVVVPLGKSPK